MITICVDAMGGDTGSEVVLEGIAQALEADQDLQVLVAGDDSVVTPFCEAHDRALPLVTTEVIEMDEHPTEAVRTKHDSSIVKGCQAVRHGEADGFFSAGSTGAIMVAATLNVGRIKGIKRPALATAIPGATGRRTVMIDMGANANTHEDMIVQFAHMGRAYSKVTLGVEDPTVALLSNGEEETKGSDQLLAFHKALKEGVPAFVGNAEGTDLLAGRYDVIVSDGFTGNVALKTLEGTAKYIVGCIKAATKSSILMALGALLLKPAIKAVAADLSGDEYGGAVLLGLKAPVIIGHGATSATAVKNGTLVCATAVRSGLVDKIAADIVVA
jgi:glycerol-3-phosphate acyltransferase PlsX